MHVGKKQTSWFYTSKVTLKAGCFFINISDERQNKGKGN